MFCDEAHIIVKAGSGGNGAVSFHREKYVAKGPPDGGDGGRGGNIIFEVNENKNTLHYFLTHRKFKGENGTDGAKRNRTGACGEDIILEVPQGKVKLTLKIEGTAEKKASTILHKISGIEKIEHIKSNEPKTSMLLIETNKESDVRKDINHQLLDNGLELLEMTQESLSLENIFRDLTS